MNPHCQLLFVYGTLLRRSRHPMAQYLSQRAAHLGPAKVTGRLYDLGRYPGLLEGGADWVHGEVFDLGADAAATLAALDRYENADATQQALYERQVAEVIRTDETKVHAWVYWYRGEVKPEQRIVSGRYG